MAEPVQIYSERGQLSYIPAALFQPPSAPPGLFQGRRRRPHRIHIANVAADPLLHERRRARRTSIVVEKLAGPREHAKRFLRSFIDPHHSSPAPADEPARSRSRASSVTIRSGLSARRSGSSSPAGRPEADPPDAMRRGSRASGSGGAGRAPARGPAAAAPAAVPEEKPVAAANGLAVSIILTEPVLFLQGFEESETADRSTAMLRGSLHVRATKSAKIKSIYLRFRGRAVTYWPEGIPPKKAEREDADQIMSHTWPFFNAQFQTAEAGPCADRVELFGPPPSPGCARAPNAPRPYRRGSPAASSASLSPRDQRRLSLQLSRSRSFGKGDGPAAGPSVAQKGYRLFQPGDYFYNFELPIDSRLPETIDVELGSVKYELEALVERAGAFRANLVGAKEVAVIRTPAEGSLEQVEPIAISRNWEDQLHYDIVISGKSFPLGARIPIAVKLTPLAKVQCHRIKVFVTENVEYFCHNKRVHRVEPARKVQLFEKRADAPPTSAFPGSTLRIVSGGGVPYDLRAAAARGEPVTASDSTNLLGNLDTDCSIGPTEMEFNVQLPGCASMKDKERSQRLHFDTTYRNIQVHHWIKVVMRLSRPDTKDPSKRRHFEISIDSPFHILSCRATQANTSLPAYAPPEPADGGAQFAECGCPGAPRRVAPALGPLGAQAPVLARPEQAHIGGPAGQPPHRPMHIIRQPSFNPPAFEEDEPPPPLQTPPPQYDTIADPASGLADYFQRLSDAYDDDSDGSSGYRGRVDLPLTPGSRVNRSMDERRSWLPLHDAGG